MRQHLRDLRRSGFGRGMHLHRFGNVRLQPVVQKAIRTREHERSRLHQWLLRRWRLLRVGVQRRLRTVQRHSGHVHRATSSRHRSGLCSRLRVRRYFYTVSGDVRFGCRLFDGLLLQRRPPVPGVLHVRR